MGHTPRSCGLGDEEGGRRTKFPRGFLWIVKRIALSRSEFLPRFEAMGETARDLSPADSTEIHLDNSRMQLYSEDSIPMCAQKTNPISRKWRRVCTQEEWVWGEGNSNRT